MIAIMEEENAGMDRVLALPPLLSGEQDWTAAPNTGDISMLPLLLFDTHAGGNYDRLFL